MPALNYDAISAKEKDRYYSRKSAGLCVACGEPLDANYIRCKACHTKMMEDNRKRIAEKKSRGECVNCVRPAEPGKTKCKVCAATANSYYRDYIKIYKEKRILNGLCPTCTGTINTGDRRCEKCRAKAREAMRLRRAKK